MKKKLLAGVLAIAVSACSVMLPDFSVKERTRTASQNDNTLVKSTNSLSRLMNSVESEQKNNETNVPQLTNYAIDYVDFDIDNSKLYVKSTQSTSCNVEVKFESDSDDGKEPLYYTAFVNAGENIATEFEINRAELPEYFIITVNLAGIPFYAECSSFVINKYGEKMQQIYNTHAEDFEPDRVVNFDDNEDTNFLVLNEKTVYAETTEDTNILCSADYDEGCFVFENADSTVSELKKGDFLYIQPDDINVIAVCVDYVENNDGKTIVYDSGDSIDEMFEFIKIENQISCDMPEIVDATYEMETESSVPRLVEETADEYSEEVYEETDFPEDFDFDSVESYNGGVYNAERNYTQSNEIEAGFNLPLPEIYGQIFLNGRIAWSINVEFYVTKELQYFTTELTTTMAMTGGFSYTTPVAGKKAEPINTDPKILELPGLDVPLGAPGCFAEWTPSFIIEFNGWFTFEYSNTTKVGVCFNSENKGDKFTPIKDLGTVEKPSSELYGDVTVGFRNSIGYTFVNKNLANASVSATAAIKFSGKVNVIVEDEDVQPVYNKLSVQQFSASVTDETLHACNTCVTGDCSLVLSLDASVDFFFGLVSFSQTFAQLTRKLFDWHYSDIEGFKFGKCQNYLYRIDFVVNGNPENIKNQSVNIYNEDTNVYKNIKMVDGSIPWIYGKNAKYTCSYDNRITNTSVKEPFEINNGPVRLSIGVDDDGNSSSGVQNLTDGKAPETGDLPDEDALKDTKTDAPEIPEIKELDMGTLGDNIGYTHYANGLLQIRGNGQMYNFKAVPFKYPEKVTEVVISSEPIDYSKYDKETNSFIRHTIEGEITNIGDHVFDGCVNLPSVIIPDTVTNIGSFAFRNCSSLKSISFPESVNTIGYNTFEGCKSFTDVVIPDTVKSVGSAAFSGCSSLKTAYLSKSVEGIPSNLFHECYSLETLKIRSYETRDSYYRGIYNRPKSAYSDLFEQNNVTYMPLTGYSLKKIIITSGEEIGAYAFRGIKIPFTVDLPDTIKSVGSFAFSDCTEMPEIIFPESLESIGGYAFENCESIKKLDFPESLTNIYAYCFSGCKGLTDVVVPDNVTYLEGAVFSKCSNLKTAVISKNITGIAFNLFHECYKLETLTYPSVETWYSGRSGSNSKAKIAYSDLFEQDNQEYKPLTDYSLKKVIISSGKSISVGAFRGITIPFSVTLPDSVTSIETGAFKDCTGITNIVLGDSVESIGYFAFEGCTNLKTAYLGKSVKTISDSAFINCRSLERITLPYCTNIKGIFDSAENLSADAENPYSIRKIEILSGDKIDMSVFNGVGTLDTVTLPENITEISFSKADVLPKINFAGTSEAWKALAGEENISAAFGAEYDKNDFKYNIYSGLNTEEPEKITGDADGDGKVSIKDAVLIARYIAGGWNVTIDESSSDVNGDKKITVIDIILIRRYLAGGWGVEL